MFLTARNKWVSIVKKIIDDQFYPTINMISIYLFAYSCNSSMFDIGRPAIWLIFSWIYRIIMHRGVGTRPPCCYNRNQLICIQLYCRYIGCITCNNDQSVNQSMISVLHYIMMIIMLSFILIIKIPSESLNGLNNGWYRRCCLLGKTPYILCVSQRLNV